MSKVIGVLVLIVGLLGCSSPWVVSDADLQFLRMPAKEQAVKFHAQGLDEQYRLVGVGNRNRHPPKVHLYSEFAKNGEAAIPLLVTRLGASGDALEVRDIVCILQDMKYSGAYIPSSNAVLMGLVRTRVDAMDGIWKRGVEEMLEDIEK